jgi:cobalt-zinc-cadmium efflux system outer membrane protein
MALTAAQPQAAAVPDIAVGTATDIAVGTATDIAMSIDAIAADVVARNPERRYIADQISAAMTGVAAADRLADPQLSVDFGEKRTSDTVTGQHLGDGASFIVSIVQPVEFGGRVALRRAIAERQLDLARIGLRQFDATLAGRARSLAYALFAAAQKADAAEVVAVRLRALEQVLISRDPSGPAPALEVAVLEGSAITAEARAASARSDYNAQLYELNGLRGAPYAARLRIIRPPVAMPALASVDALAAAANAGNFELQSLRSQLEQQGLGVQLARRSRFGALAIGPYYQRDRTNTIDTTAGVRLTVPLPVWNRQASDVGAAQGRQAQADAALIAAERRVDRLVFEQASLYRTRVDALSHWPDDAPQRFEVAAKAADRAYRLGAVPLAIYIEMQRQYLEAQTAVLDSRRDAITALGQLNALTGETLPAKASQ